MFTRDLYPHPHLHPRPLPASRDPRHLDILWAIWPVSSQIMTIGINYGHYVVTIFYWAAR